jgi:hypothetical protein
MTTLPVVPVGKPIREVIRTADQLKPIAGSAFSAAWVKEAQALQPLVADPPPRKFLFWEIGRKELSDAKIVQRLQAATIDQPVAGAKFIGAATADEIPFAASAHWTPPYVFTGGVDYDPAFHLTSAFSSVCGSPLTFVARASIV